MSKEENSHKKIQIALFWLLFMCFSIPSFAFQSSKLIINAKANSFFTYKDGRELPAVQEQIETNQNSDRNGMLLAISSLLLTRKMANRCLKQEFKLEQLTAKIHTDTLVLTFRNKDVPGSGINNKMLEICLKRNEILSTNFYHSSDKLRILENSSGGSQLVPALKSRIEEIKITLNSASFSQGSIIKGELILEASYNPSSKYRRVEEKMKGQFRCIIE